MTILGPYHVESVNGSPLTKTKVTRRERYKTTRREVAPYMIVTSTANIPGRWVSDADYIASSQVWGNGQSARQYARAYDSFMGKLRGGSQKSDAIANLGVTFAEWGQSRNMIMKRLRDVNVLVNAVRRRNFANFLWGLGLEVPASARDHWKRRKGEAIEDEVLEYSFGWVPLFQDIYAAARQLGREFPTSRVTGTNFQGKEVSNEGTYLWNYTAHLWVRVSADVVVTNPNVALANSLGLLNPASVAWDVVPFSFLVEGFVPLGRYLESFTDTLGFGLSNRVVSYQSTVVGTFRPTSSQEGTATSRFYRRTIPPDFAIPTLYSRVRVPNMNFGYAVTLSALAVQQWKAFKSS